jgi:hypothetical protein
METRAARVLLITSVVGCLVSCAPVEPASAPREGRSHAERDGQIAQDQRALEHRRQQLENQLLADLRKLRESRQASTAGAAPASDERAPAVDYELLVFGGPIHDAFLGCLCDDTRPDSVFNMTGEHGSDLSPMSIRNKFSPYGSNYDDTSACNAAATHPPVVVTSDGKSLGLLTINPSLKKRITAPSVADWLARMCGV